MFSRIRKSLGLALLLSLLASMTVHAKGGFSFITVTGADLKGEVRISDPALTEDFFTFANFFEDRADAPADPGIGYEITRYYVDGKREIVFDRLHYHPEAGYVYYDGIVNGSSEYDGKWYAAIPEVHSRFESALNTELRMMGLREPEAWQAQMPSAGAADPAGQEQPAARATMQPLVISILLVVVIAVLLAFAFWSRKSPLDEQPKGG
jgi:hypothetical protein